MQFETGDYVKHAIFGKWVYIEWYESQCIVRFEKRGNKKTQHSLIELVTPKTVITPDPFEEKNNEYRNSFEKRQEKITTNQLD